MLRFSTAAGAALSVLTSASLASAQLIAGREAPIVYGHHHLNPTSIPEHKKFWVDTLGGVLATAGTNNLEIIKFPNVLVFWRTNQKPTGGSKGTTADHIGFSVPDLGPVLARVRANGFRVVTREETPADWDVKDGIAVVGGRPTLAFVMGPDDVKVELVQNAAQQVPVTLHHHHFFSHQNAAMRDWYVKVFGATPRDGARFLSADLPGVALNFTASPDPVAATTGRVVDHIGFEVKNLEAFTKQLEAQGIPLTVSYRRIAALDTAIAFITDPWGTSIELSEGLVKIP